MKYTTINSLCEAVAESIRSVEGSTELINPQDFPARIAALQVGGGGSTEPTEITFKVNDTEYTAMSNMTWEDFCNSEYNDGGWVKLFFDCEALGNGSISASDSGMDAGVVQLNGSNVYKTDAIKADANYTTTGGFGA